MDYYLMTYTASRHLDALRRAQALTDGTHAGLPGVPRRRMSGRLRVAVGRTLVAAGTRLQPPATEGLEPRVVG